MASVEPIYTAANCQFAYQLNWSLSLFWRKSPGSDSWLKQLQAAAEGDGIRVLKHRFSEPRVSLFLVSTKPEVAPVKVAAWVKGRLQYLVRDEIPKAFQRNYALKSTGSTRRDKLENYIASQLQQHPLADARVHERFVRYQIWQPSVDLSQLRFTSHAQFVYNLHLVLEQEGGWREIRDDVLQKTRAMLLQVSAAKGHLLSRAGILPDHIHCMLGCNLEEAPADVALSYLNNIALACGMKQVFKFSCFIGTFGEYDLGAIH